jgi:hypothetical protein
MSFRQQENIVQFLGLKYNYLFKKIYQPFQSVFCLEV